MQHTKFLLPLAFLLFRSTDSGSPCPPRERIKPCFCSNFEDGQTVLICPGIQNTSQMEQVTKSLKSMILDRLLLLDIFIDDDTPDETDNLVEPIMKNPVFGMLPKKWLTEVRIRKLEIQNGHLNSCFLCEDALEGQSDFLTSLVVKNAKLKGHVCSTCSLGSGPTSVSTRELKRTPLLQCIDFSHNDIEVVDGHAFPASLSSLSKIVLSNNRISRIHDNAFANLSELAELDLSRNQLTTISRKIFKSLDITLKIIDLSYNSIQTLPEDIFSALSGLREIKLSHNLLEVLPSTTWTRIPSLLEKIDLRGNFLICNCSMNWIPRRLSKSTKVIGQCISPREVEFQDLKPSLPTLTTC